jgi:hypothetical protein
MSVGTECILKNEDCQFVLRVDLWEQTEQKAIGSTSLTDLNLLVVKTNNASKQTLARRLSKLIVSDSIQDIHECQLETTEDQHGCEE